MAHPHREDRTVFHRRPRAQAPSPEQLLTSVHPYRSPDHPLFGNHMFDVHLSGRFTEN